MRRTLRKEKLLALQNRIKSKMIHTIIINKMKKETNTFYKKQPKSNDESSYMCVHDKSSPNRALRRTFKSDNFKISLRTKNNIFKMINNIAAHRQQSQSLN